MNDTIQCANGLCGHPEHAINALVWFIPIIAGACLIYKIYKNLKIKKD